MSDEEPRRDDRQDEARVSRLSGGTSRLSVDDVADSGTAVNDGSPQAGDEKRKRDLSADVFERVPPGERFRDLPPRETKAKTRPIPRSYSTLNITPEERTWAAIAHASAWLTLLGGFFTIGALIPASVFIPLAVYFMFRQKSDFVAFHALQAFVLQLVGTLGAAALLLIGGMVWGVGLVVSLLLMVLLIGFVLLPVWALVGLGLLLVVLALPVAMVLYSTFAAVETYNGRDYRYPYIARWVDRQLAGGLLNVQ